MEESMAAKYASWVHGCAVVPEKMGMPPQGGPLLFANEPGGPDGSGGVFSDVNGLRRADGAFFKIAPNHGNWFHFSIPTPVFLEDKRATLGSVFALFSIDRGLLDQVFVFDASKQLLFLGELNVSGNHLGGLDGGNSFVVNHDAIGFGVCFSVHFPAFGDPKGADLHIAAAGADFFHNI